MTPCLISEKRAAAITSTLKMEAVASSGSLVTAYTVMYPNNHNMNKQLIFK
jgi:hypothetical protein